jgi:hypothetical protein
MLTEYLGGGVKQGIYEGYDVIINGCRHNRVMADFTKAAMR